MSSPDNSPTAASEPCNTNADCVGVGSGGRFPSTVCYRMTFSVCGPRCDLIGGNAFCSMILPGSTCNLVTGECR